MNKSISEDALDVLFLEARTHTAWLDAPLAEGLLRQIWDLARMGPTSANCSPARIVFVASPEAKERLKPHLAEGNVEKTMAAPVTAVIGHDMEFFEKLPELFPHADARSWFAGNEELIAATAFRNATLQAAYFMLAARALGLDCGPMSGFDNEAVDKEFFAATAVKSNFLCNLGVGDPRSLNPRSPRMSFNDACKMV